MSVSLVEISYICTFGVHVLGIKRSHVLTGLDVSQLHYIHISESLRRINSQSQLTVSMAQVKVVEIKTMVLVGDL